MSAIFNPQSGPSLGRMAENGCVIDAAKEGYTPLTSGVVFVTRSIVSRDLSTGLYFNIRCDVNGNYTVIGVDTHQNIYTLQPSTAYTASSGTIQVIFSRYITEAYVQFTPSSTSNNLFIEGFSYGRGY